MAEKQDRQISAPQERENRDAMLMRASYGAPDKKDWDRKHQRLGHDPGEAKALPTVSGVDLANEERADYPELGTQRAP
jgi:hypothetical protein